VEERDERQHLPTERDEARAAEVVQAVADFVDDLVEEEADADPDEPVDPAPGGNGAA
jgi:hypothetical protein